MTGADGGVTPGVDDGDAKTFKVSREVIRTHLAGRRCPSCPGVPESFQLGQELPRCEVYVYAAEYVRKHWQGREWLRAANQVADELLELMRPKPTTADAGRRGRATSGDR